MLLPPHTRHLRKGLGVGTQRAFRASGGTVLTYKDRRPRPERATTPLREAEGFVLAHHTHLEEYRVANGGATRWAAWTSTVVYAELGAATRAAGEVSAGRRDVATGATLQFGRPKPVVGQTQEVRDGVTWTFRPAVPAGTVDAVAPAFAGAPEGTQVEIEYGALCVWVGRELTDPAELDALCRVATAVVAGLESVLEPELDPAEPVGPPLPDPGLEAGVASVKWPQPPRDVATAVAAYATGGRRFGLLAGLAFFVVAVAGAAGGIWLGLTTGLAVGGPVTAVFAVVLFVLIVRAALRTGRELSHEQRMARARPLGLQAFVDGYAAAHGLTAEDPDAVTRRFASPLRGRAVAALHGPDGHHLLWREPGGAEWLLRVTRRGVERHAGWAYPLEVGRLT